MNDEFSPDSIADHQNSGGTFQSQIETSKEGIDFDVYADSWQLSNHRALYVNEVLALYDVLLHHGLRQTLAHKARNKADGTCISLGDSLLHFARTMYPKQRVPAWRSVDLQNYRVKICNEFGDERKLQNLRPFLKSWNNLRHPGVDTDVIDELKAMKLKAPETGRAVRSNDPEEGPLEPTELHMLSRDIAAAYETSELSLPSFGIAIFHIATGRRPAQSAALKCKDVDNTSVIRNGKPVLLTHVPRFKQGGKFRTEFRSIDWTPEFFAIFKLQRQMVGLEYSRLLEKHGWNLQSQDFMELHAQMPLFPMWSRVIATLGKLETQLEAGAHGAAMAELRKAAAGSLWHQYSIAITRTLQEAVEKAGTLSRNGTPLNMNAYRLRYSKGTDLAREGLGRNVIGWLLDHSNLISAGIYIDNLPEHAIPANRAMAMSPTMQGLAQLFRGKVVDREEDAVGGTDPKTSRIHFKGNGAASCGTRKNCGLGDRIPRCCYVCPSFQPWLEGPHLEVLQELLNERREREDALGVDHAVTKNADPTIVAVINVIQRCEARRQELTKSNNSNNGNH